jgi:hypothetical protein
MTDCELGFGPSDPVLTPCEPGGRWASTNHRTDAGCCGTFRVLYATALAKAVVNSDAFGPTPVPLD